MKAFISYLVAHRFNFDRPFAQEHEIILTRAQVDDVLGPGLTFGSDLFDSREITIEQKPEGERITITGRVAAIERIEGPEPKFKFSIITERIA